MSRSHILSVIPVLCVILLTGCAAETEPTPEPLPTSTVDTVSPMGYKITENNTGAINPVEGFDTAEQVSYFGDLNTGHTGVDVLVPELTPVVSVGAGTIRTVGWKNGYGSRVLVDYAYGEQLVSVTYGHLSADSIENLTPGDSVQSGDIIGTVAVAGEDPKVTIPRLHFEVSIQNNPVDSVTWLQDHVIL